MGDILSSKGIQIFSKDVLYLIIWEATLSPHPKATRQVERDGCLGLLLFP